MQISILISYFEHYEFYTAWRYSATYYNICLALFYSSILPLSVFYCFWSTFIKYFSDKYILISRSNAKVGYSEKMSLKITSELNIFFLYFVLGIFFKDILVTFYKYGEVKISLVTYILFIISIIFIFIPFKKLIMIIKDKMVFKNNNYDQLNKNILKGYKTTNKFDNLLKKMTNDYNKRNIFINF